MSVEPSADGPHGETGANAEPSVAGPQAEAGVTSRPAPDSAPGVLDAAQRALLRATLNRIIPPQTGLPGAGDLDVGDSIERTLATSTRLRRLFIEGLLQIELTSGPTQRFADVDAARQTTILQTVEQHSRAFFVALVEHTYRGYYTLPVVQREVGLVRPPQPLGHTLPPFDPALLEQQRQRAPFWRRID